MAEGAVEGFADSAKNGLTSKIGGIPFYVYGIGFVAAFWAYKKFAGNKTEQPVITQDLVRPGGLQAASDGNLSPSSGTVFSGSGTGGGVNTSNTIPGALDGDNWIAQGTAYLASLGYDGSKANQFLSNYVSGVAPVGEGARYVNLAVGRFGSPTTPVRLQPGDLLNSPQLVRVIAQPQNDGIFGQYSDGQIRWFTNPTDLIQAAKTSNNPNVYDPSTGRINTIELSRNDPIWSLAGIVFPADGSPYVPQGNAGGGTTGYHNAG
jgi:hypothetical protein